MTVHVEDRLRSDLPRLADRLLDVAADARVHEPVGLRGADASTRSPRARVLVGAGAIALVVALAVGATALVTRRDSASLRAGTSGSGAALAIEGPYPWPCNGPNRCVGSTASPPAPLSARSSPALAWLGNQEFVWGGIADGFAVGDGVAYNVSREVWSTVPRGPSGPIMGTSTDCSDPAASRAESVRCEERRTPGALIALIKNSGARYDATTRTWTELPRIGAGRESFGAVTSYRGTAYALVGSVRDGRSTLAIAELGTDDQWHLGPATRRGVLNRSGVHSRSVDLTVDRGSLALWSDGVRVAVYDVEGGSWHDGDNLALPRGFDAPQIVGRDDGIVAIDRSAEHAPVAYDAKADRWVRLPGGRDLIGRGGAAVWTGDGVLVWGGVRPGLWIWTIAE